MAENDPEFKDKVKNSFLKAKEHMNSLENQIRELKELILVLKEENSLQKQNGLNNMAEELKRSLLNDQIQNVSSGNDGVVTNKQTNKQVTLTKQINDINQLKDLFRSLTKQKLRLYLAVYNMEDEKNPVTYLSLSKNLGLSEESIRVYTFRIIQKGIPLDKQRVNNKLIVFKIPEMVRTLNLKQFLEDLYYGTDGSQSRLTDL